MSGMYMGGAVYNNYLSKQMDLPTEGLTQVIQAWDERSLLGKISTVFNPFVNYELMVKAAKDLIAAREDPEGEVAGEINWKLEDYRAEKKEMKGKSKFARVLHEYLDL